MSIIANPIPLDELESALHGAAEGDSIVIGTDHGTYIVEVERFISAEDGGTDEVFIPAELSPEDGA